MKKYNKYTTSIHGLTILVFLACTLLNGCGGAVGNIDRYEYDLKLDKLTTHVNNVIHNNPSYSTDELEETYKVISGEGIPDVIYILVATNNQKIVFGFRIVSVEDRSMIVLIYSAQYGQILKLPKNISSFDKRRYSSIFKANFLEKLNAEIIE